MEYIVLVGETSQDLIKKVNEHIQAKWKPLGGVSISISESDDYLYAYYAQAMVRYFIDLPEN